MTTTPAPVQPVETPDLSPALQALDDFERAFVLRGSRAQCNISARLLLPFVNDIPYEFLISECECADREVWYVRDQRYGNWFYAVCHAHRLQPLGRAIRCAKQHGDDGSRDNATRRRKSGYTTHAWHAARTT
jgi:hypothetical protein